MSRPKAASLRLWIPGVLLAIGIALQLLVLRSELGRAVERTTDERIAQASLLGVMASRHLGGGHIQEREGVDALMDLLAGEPSVRRAAIVDHRDRLRVGTDRDHPGQDLAAAGLAEVAPLIDAVRRDGRSHVEVTRAPPAVLAVFPIREASGAVLVLAHDLGEPLAEARYEAIRRALTQGALVLAACFVLYLFSRRFILTRLARLVEASRAIAAGNYAARTGVVGGDEIGALASAFDHMAGDIEAREAALVEGAARLESLLGNLDDAVLVIDLEGVVRYASGSAPRVLGVAPDELVGREIFAVFEDFERDRVLRVLDQARADAPRRAMLEVSTSLRGTPRRFDVSIHWPSLPELVGGAIVNVRDVTERRRLEAQVLAQQKMEVVGQLAGGVAHDFNNLLGVIVLHAEAVLAAETESWPHRHLISDIYDTAVRGGELTRQLLATGRRNVRTTSIVDVNQIVREVQRLLERLVPENVAISVELSPQACWILGNQGLIEQVLVNLVINARDAMPSGGELWLRTRLEGVAGRGGEVVLEVEDTGTGIDPAIRDDIFEPFVSTKPVGVGTGLGLATVHGIVRDLCGDIDIESEPGQGATFRLRFSASDSLPTAEHADPAPAAVELGGSETIVYVEDQPAVREGVVSALTQQGYRVLAFASAEDALETFPGVADEVALLASDLMLPGISGYELWQKLCRQRAALPVVFLSGYTDAADIRAQIAEQGITLLQKPFDSQTLIAELRRVLDAPASRATAAAPAASRAVVLVAEDEPILLDAMCGLLELEGYEVLAAADGARALELFRERVADLGAVILDMSIPLVDGVEALAAMRELDASVPVLAASGFESEAIRRAVDAGELAGFVQKPFAPDDLLDRVRRLSGAHSSPAALRS